MANYSSLIVLGVLASTNAFTQGTISTVAGGSGGFQDNIPAVQARISGPSALAIDQRGNAYIGDGTRIRKIDVVTGIISTVTADTGAQQLAFDAKGKLVILFGNRVLKLDLGTDALTTIAGTAGATTPQFGSMVGLATDIVGNIFITDGYYDKIYRIDAASGAVSTFAGATGSGASPQGDGGPATLAYLGRPSAITLDPFGNVFFVEPHWLRRIDGRTGIITTIAPNGGTGASGDGGTYNKAIFGNITALATDTKGNLYIADAPHLRKIDWNTGIVSTIAGSGQQQYGKNGVPALDANLSFMTGLVVDAQGNIWIADSGNARVFIIAASTNLIRTVAGTSANGDGGPALGAGVVSPRGLAADALGNFYFFDGGIRRVDHTTGFISTITPRTALAFQGVLGNGASPIALDSGGNVFLSAEASVQRVDALTGAVTVVAGDGFGQYGEGGALGDGGSATKAQVTPSGVAIDSSGNLYIADYWYERIRRVDVATGIINTVAGTGQGQTFSGITGPALQTSIGVPTSIAIAANGDIYWTTSGWVLKMNSGGALSIAAGNGGCGYSGDGGSALLAMLCSPSAIAFDGAGNLLVSESACDCIRRVDATTGLIQTVAGTGNPGVSNDGIPATQAALMPGAVAFSGGVLYIVDAHVDLVSPGRIRAVTPPVPPPLPQPPSIIGISDAVDYRSAFSPGAIVSVSGNYLGGPSPLSGQAGTNGVIANMLGGDQVTFNGVPGPLLYVSAGQINTVVPFSTQLGTATVQVNTSAGTNAVGGLTISSSSLSLYPGLVFNPDGTLNGPENPAPKGATLVMYGTGMGQTSPPVQDGSIVQGPSFPMPETQFSATVMNGTTEYPATIQYLGPLPGFVAGAVQANIQIPDTVPAGKSSLFVGPATGLGSGQTIFMLSDPPLLSGISPASPIPQSVGNSNYLTLSGRNLTAITAVNFFLNGQPVGLSLGFQCASTSCIINVGFGGVAGEYGVTVTNAAHQVSNQLTFSVQPYSPPTVTGVRSYTSSGPLVATKGIQFVTVIGTNFLAADTVTVYYNGSVIATLNSSSPLPPQIISSGFIYIDFDFQGNAGQYAVQVAGSNGSSGLFNFTVATP